MNYLDNSFSSSGSFTNELNLDQNQNFKDDKLIFKEN